MIYTFQLPTFRASNKPVHILNENGEAFASMKRLFPNRIAEYTERLTRNACTQLFTPVWLDSFLNRWDVQIEVAWGEKIYTLKEGHHPLFDYWEIYEGDTIVGRTEGAASALLGTFASIHWDGNVYSFHREDFESKITLFRAGDVQIGTLHHSPFRMKQPFSIAVWEEAVPIPLLAAMCYILHMKHAF